MKPRPSSSGKPPDPHTGQVPGAAVAAEIAVAWAREAEDRLAAYRRGEIQAVGEDDVFGEFRNR